MKDTERLINSTDRRKIRISIVLLFLISFTQSFAQNWKQLETHSDVTDNDICVIYEMATGCALSSELNSEKRPKAVKLEILDGTLNDEQITENLKWTFKKLDNGNYCISPTSDPSKVLYWEKSSIVTVGTPTNDAEWSLDCIEGQYNGMRETTSQNLLCAYSGKDWRLFAANTVNESDVRIVLFRHVEVSQIESPTFSVPNGTFYDDFYVTIQTADDATIYYTLDGSEPTTQSTVYDTPVRISPPATLKAVAEKDGQASTVAVAEYLKGVEISSIRAFKELTPGTQARLSLTDATVVHVWRDEIYLQDATGGLCLQVSTNNFMTGEIVNGTITGKYEIRGGIPMLTESDDIALSHETAATPEAQPATIADLQDELADYVCTLVKIEDVTFDGNQYLVQPSTGQQIRLYDRFGILSSGQYWPALADVSGLLLPVDEQPCIAIRSWEDIENVSNLAIPELSWSQTTCTADINENVVNTFPTLHTNSDGSVTYASSDRAVAQTDAEGNIVLISTGTTTITAFLAETAAFSSASTSYTLTVINTGRSAPMAFVASYNGTNYAVAAQSTNNKLKAEQVYLVNGKAITTSDPASISWYANPQAPEEGIKSADGQYIAYISSADVKLQDTPYKWDYNTEEGRWQINDGSTVRAIAFNGSTFGAYSVNYGYILTQTFPVTTGYRRPTTTGCFGTICLPQAVRAKDFTGATFYRIEGKTLDANNEPAQLVLAPTDMLEAGEPYLFQAEAEAVILAYSGATQTAPLHANGLYGVFAADEASAEMLEGKYLLSDNTVVKCGTGCSLGANRAYIDMEEVPVITAPAEANRLILPVSGTTSISETSIRTNGIEPIYSITGIKMGDTDRANLKPGIYIISGKTIVVNK